MTSSKDRSYIFFIWVSPKCKNGCVGALRSPIKSYQLCIRLWSSILVQIFRCCRSSLRWNRCIVSTRRRKMIFIGGFFFFLCFVIALFLQPLNSLLYTFSIFWVFFVFRVAAEATANFAPRRRQFGVSDFFWYLAKAWFIRLWECFHALSAASISSFKFC